VDLARLVEHDAHLWAGAVIMMGPACVCLTQLVSGQLFHVAGIRDR
jgi:hypothetical protein